MKKIKEIYFTRAEEEIMQILWKIERGVVKDIVEHFPEPKPAYNTVSTIIRILESKGFVDHKAYGKTHEYFPLITKEDYSKKVIKNFVKGYFNNSFQKMVSFFSSAEEMDIKELEETLNLMQKQIQNRKKS
jgi:BlaI family transcriptional regulator, penicillinase repressor